jgi:diguanylate cyclase (GGDEF)-like protein
LPGPYLRQPAQFHYIMIDAATYFERISARAAVVYSITMLVAVAVLDYEIGRELTLSPLYLIPVMLITWKCSATAGIAMSMAAYGLLGGVTLLESGMTSLGYVLWEGSLRLGTALLFIIALSRLKDSLAREQQLARNDSLTELANRVSFYELVNLEMLRCRRYGGVISIAFIDLDNFKALNDQSGHGVGDEALRVVAQIMRTQLRANDLAARLGGDEFAIMFAGLAARGAGQAMQILQSRLLSAMRERGWPITFSIGLATFTKVPDSVDEMIRRADMLMYEIKRERRGGINERVFP